MGLRSIKEIFITGHGPSSSHTMGPYFASQYILEKYKDKGIKHIKVTLFGSLALTGKGHLTDYIIDVALKDVSHEIIFDTETVQKHPNTINFKVETEEKTYSENVVSIGGGSIVTVDNIDSFAKADVYPHSHMKEIVDYCVKEDISMYQYVTRFEGELIVLWMLLMAKLMI